MSRFTRVFQIYLATGYFISGVSKMLSTPWTSGYALYYIVRNNDIVNRSSIVYPLVKWLTDTFPRMMTYSILFSETLNLPLTIASQVTRYPNPDIVYIYICACVCVHVNV